jgi:hypothetical protein
MMMKDFSKRILIEQNFYPEFFFHVLHTACGKYRYQVSVIGPKGENVFFTIDKDSSGLWKIVDAPKVPEWIMNTEKRLADAIAENLAQ